jgi:hypothetical protein
MSRRLLAAVIVLTVFLGVAPAQAATNHPLLFSVSELPSQHPPLKEYIEDPCGLAVDATGNFYVSDYYHDAIEVFGPAGQFEGRFNGIEPLDGPCGLALDSSGHLYVNDFHRDVVRYPISELVAGAGTVIDSGHSTGVAVDPSTGNVFVDDRTYIAEYEPSGAPVLDSEGEPVRIGLGSLGEGYGVAVSSFPATAGDVYVADASAGAVKVYDPSVDPANPAMVIRGEGTPQAGFESLGDSALALNQFNGHLFVLDDLQPLFEHPQAAVDEFNAAGDYRGQIAQPIIVDGGPSGLAVDNSAGPTRGRVYVSSGNSEEARVFAFGPTAAGYVLEVTTGGSGEGEVNSKPAGIACGDACTAEFTSGESVALTAAPAAGSRFAGWTVNGNAATCPGTGSCQVTLSADTEVRAEFEALPLLLPALAPSAAGIEASNAGDVAPAPDSDSLLRVARPSVDGSFATVLVEVSVPGTLSVSGAGLAKIAPRRVPGGRTPLHLRLDRKGRRALRDAKGHRLALRITVTFRPSGTGSEQSLNRTVSFTARGLG